MMESNKVVIEDESLDDWCRGDFIVSDGTVIRLDTRFLVLGEIPDMCLDELQTCRNELLDIHIDGDAAQLPGSPPTLAILNAEIGKRDEN